MKKKNIQEIVIKRLNWKQIKHFIKIIRTKWEIKRTGTRIEKTKIMNFDWMIKLKTNKTLTKYQMK
jgi:hypothetical protein